MNRVVTRIAVLGLCVALLPSAQAIGKKKKKQQGDLSQNPLASVNSKQPDKELFDKAMTAMKKGKYDVARLDLQTLLNTYPETEYAMRAKLAIGDTWYKEGGSAALTQAEAEYKDFITFFPNTPEAAEAQMKVGDIYFQQMEKPDRDPQNAVHAEQEYRTMIQDFPDSTLIPRAKQRLREVQEVLAQRQYEIGMFYSTRENYPAAIARLQTVSDSYPLFSHSDMTLITLGDAYAQQAAMAQRLNIPPAAKTQLVNAFHDRAAAEWEKVVLRYPMAPHVEDAKDRLIALGRPVPEPTQQELAESEAEEGSRVNVTLKGRAMMLVKHTPSTVEAARVGEPTLTDPPPTLAPQVTQQTTAIYKAAMNGQPLPGAAPATASDANAAAINNGTAPPRTGQPAQMRLETVPDSSGSPGSTVTVEIPNGGAPAASNADAPAAGASANPNGTNAGANANTTTSASPMTGTSADVNRAVKVKDTPVVNAVAPTNNQPLPPVDKP
ncbi:MAG: outer membrane protein assembly factor BamD, partial [Silvibacterium sp.]|nr:outer membrane protein assembly factor BamD [Silvibacterium sp.]